MVSPSLEEREGRGEGSAAATEGEENEGEADHDDENDVVGDDGRHRKRRRPDEEERRGMDGALCARMNEAFAATICAPRRPRGAWRKMNWEEEEEEEAALSSRMGEMNSQRVAVIVISITAELSTLSQANFAVAVRKSFSPANVVPSNGHGGSLRLSIYRRWPPSKDL